jgi:hypothetical protein
MELTSFAELNTTREKLQDLEALYSEQEQTPSDNPFVRELSQRSLRRLIKQLKEEIARFEAKTAKSNRVDPSKTNEPSISSTSRE